MLTFTRYIELYFTCAFLDCVRYNEDFVKTRFHCGTKHNFFTYPSPPPTEISPARNIISSLYTTHDDIKQLFTTKTGRRKRQIRRSDDIWCQQSLLPLSLKKRQKRGSTIIVQFHCSRPNPNFWASFPAGSAVWTSARTKTPVILWKILIRLIDMFDNAHYSCQTFTNIEAAIGGRIRWQVE